MTKAKPKVLIWAMIQLMTIWVSINVVSKSIFIIAFPIYITDISTWRLYPFAHSSVSQDHRTHRQKQPAQSLLMRGIISIITEILITSTNRGTNIPSNFSKGFWICFCGGEGNLEGSLDIVVIWSNCDKELLNRVFKLQKRAARVILFADRLAPL